MPLGVIPFSFLNILQKIILSMQLDVSLKILIYAMLYVQYFNNKNKNLLFIKNVN